MYIVRCKEKEYTCLLYGQNFSFNLLSAEDVVLAIFRLLKNILACPQGTVLVVLGGGKSQVSYM